MLLAGIQVNPTQRDGLIWKVVHCSFLCMPPVNPFHTAYKQVTLHYFFWSGVKMESQVLKYSMVGALTTKPKELNQSRGKATVLRDASLSLNKPGIRTVEQFSVLPTTYWSTSQGRVQLKGLIPEPIRKMMLWDGLRKQGLACYFIISEAVVLEAQECSLN